MSDELGSGPNLDQDFDFTIDTVGDLDTVSGVDDLQKDVAFQLTVTLDQYIGQPPSQNTAAQIRDTAERTASLDTRVRSATAPKGSVSFEDRNTIAIELQLTTTAGETFQNVFTVGDT